MERTYLADLIRWKDDPLRKPLMVWGARQVGKSYLIEELFAKKYYPGRYLRIDCSDDVAFTQTVIKNSKLSDVLQYIELRYGFRADANHLIIFDEAQECLPVVKMMKHFCEQRRDIPVIVTGSMVRLKILRKARRQKRDDDIPFLFPVGKINELNIYPLTFSEFLFNANRAAYEYAKDHFERGVPAADGIHEELMKTLYDYLFCGGMPEVDSVFLSLKGHGVDGHAKAYEKMREIYDNYLADMDLYQASTDSIARTRLVYRDISRQLNKENKNFKFSEVQNGLKGRDLVDPIAWLLLSRVALRSSLVKEHVIPPLVPGADSLMRLYLSDVGMFTYQSGMNAREFLLNRDNAFAGIFYESYVAQELDAHGFELFYWKRKGESELEFLVQLNGRIVPIDVKKNRGRLNSLDAFRLHNPRDIAIKIAASNYGYNSEKMVLTVPLYDVSFLFDQLAKGELPLPKGSPAS